MGPPLNTTTTTPRRQSCDRCHGQKLRCIRPYNRKSGTCERCLRKGVVCVYSSSLPKGRPSLYRLSDVPSAPKSPSSSTAPSSTTTSTRAGATLDDTSESPNATSPFPAMPASPIQPPRDQQFESTQLDPQIHGFANFWPSWWHDDQIGDSMLGIVPTAIPPFIIDPALETQAALSVGQDKARTPAGTGSGAGGGAHIDEDGRCLENEQAETRSVAKGIHESRSGAASTVNDNGFELSVVHLSRLSTRLSQLLSPSRTFLAEFLHTTWACEDKDSAAQLQLGIEAVFKSVNDWLMQGPAPSGPTAAPPHHLDEEPQSPIDLLQHMLSASSHLLNIVQNVRESTVRASEAAPSPSTSTTAKATATCGSTYDPHHGSHAYLVAHQLVIVCVTLLLNMDVTILLALQRSADALKSQQQTASLTVAAPAIINQGMHMGEVQGGRTMHKAERVHLQLVTVVQFCAHFIRRQNQTLDMLVASSQLSKLHDPRGSLEAVRELKIEVEQQLKQIQNSLCTSS
ncbi:hypothetical protein M406DRAFT_327767 [Cryphonectria parasitica EP155]|uniref:Zn(2)-C6 fungal-type domain-containing protein n=1 Tax=Cryphonectria parasitica (strain ATCC 38755 / EP155) TaxID=660469 RepID=A0A9P5CQN9_CRYP1|nr:uncharacterized protein M406DRAFT_327767 [Cryphonectria parasitica EP155]KAF3766637.1 hypothetical protein M406DRAFT_327767 [Cryphonectria parasitica EP155]